jgi:hypothetical protein
MTQRTHSMTLRKSTREAHDTTTVVESEHTSTDECKHEYCTSFLDYRCVLSEARDFDDYDAARNEIRNFFLFDSQFVVDGMYDEKKAAQHALLEHGYETCFNNFAL